MKEIFNLNEAILVKSRNKNKGRREKAGVPPGWVLGPLSKDQVSQNPPLCSLHRLPEVVKTIFPADFRRSLVWGSHSWFWFPPNKRGRFFFRLSVSI